MNRRDADFLCGLIVLGQRGMVLNKKKKKEDSDEMLGGNSSVRG